MIWDFAEAIPLSESTGSIEDSFAVACDAIRSYPSIINKPGTILASDATAVHPLPDAGASVWFTDPPYYDAIPYADLSDFFFVWLKRIMPGHPLLRDPYDAKNLLTPKTQEACAMKKWDPRMYC